MTDGHNEVGAVTALPYGEKVAIRYYQTRFITVINGAHETVTNQLAMFTTDAGPVQLTYAELYDISVVGEGNEGSYQPGRCPADYTPTALIHRHAPAISSRSATARSQQ